MEYRQALSIMQRGNVGLSPLWLYQYSRRDGLLYLNAVSELSVWGRTLLNVTSGS